MTTLVYWERLGDVLRMLPAAKHLAESGEEVFIACSPRYSGVLDLVTYAKWTPEPKGEIIDLQIWPTRYEKFRESGKSWMDFVYSDPRISAADRTVVLDNLPNRSASGLPVGVNLLAPHGVSQGFEYPVHWSIDRAKEQMHDFVLMHDFCNCFYTVPHWSAPSIADLALAIRDAGLFMCINSAPAILASALRQGRPTYFLPQQGTWAQDNCDPWPGRMDWDGQRFL